MGVGAVRADQGSESGYTGDPGPEGPPRPVLGAPIGLEPVSPGPLAGQPNEIGGDHPFANLVK